MSRSIMAIVLSLYCLTVLSIPGLAQEGEVKAKEGPAKIDLGDKIATIDLPKGYAFIEQETAREILRAQANNDENVLGMVVPTDSKKEDPYFVVCTFDDIGYVKDNDADKINPDELMDQYREGNKQQNEELRERGLPEIFVADWAESPHYDRKQHHVIWAIGAKDEDSKEAPVTVINYNTRILGRKGVLSMNLVTEPDSFKADKSSVNTLLAKTAFTPGNKYEEYQPGKDKDSGMGLTGLILGGGALAVAAKSGLLGALGKWFLAALVFGKKFIVIIVAAVGALIAKLFGKKKDPDQL